MVKTKWDCFSKGNRVEVSANPKNDKKLNKKGGKRLPNGSSPLTQLENEVIIGATVLLHVTRILLEK